MTDLTSNGVFGVEKIELKRKPFPNFQGIYFITPTKENFDFIEQDAIGKIYKFFHIYTTNEIPNGVMSHLAGKSLLISKIITLKELNIDFRTIDDCTFTLETKNLLHKLYYDDSDNEKILSHLAKKLYCALSVMMPTASLEVTFQKTKIC